MDKCGVVINGLIGPKLIRDYFTTGQSTKKTFNTQSILEWKKLQLVEFLGRIDFYYFIEYFLTVCIFKWSDGNDMVVFSPDIK